MPPTYLQTVLDAVDHRGLAEFYRALLGWEWRPGDEGRDHDWLVLLGPDGRRLAFQHVEVQVPTTWPDTYVPQQLHLDLTVPDAAALEVECTRAVDLGAVLLADRADDPDEPLRVYADPAGHPFCLFVA